MSLERKHINPPELFRHPGYSRAVTVEGPMKLVFIAGQTASGDNYECVAPGDYRGQYLAIMDRLAISLEAAGATWDDVVFRRIYTVDMDEFGKAALHPDNPTWFDPERPPPSTLIGVTRLSFPEFLIEIDLLAVTEAS